MTDLALAAPPVAGRSLWADAWSRLKGNKAAVVGAIYLVVIALACIIGPWFTPHEFTTIYQDYVRQPPSLSPYPKTEMIGPAVDDAVKRARLNLAEWHEHDGEVTITVTSAKPIDERVTRYIDRSDMFEGTKVLEKSPDGLKLVMTTGLEKKYFLLGTDISGRDMLTRTLIAGRVSLAIGLLAGLV